MDLPPGTNNPPNALGVTDANREWSTNSIQVKKQQKNMILNMKTNKYPKTR